jgi:hypothetical protein
VVTYGQQYPASVPELRQLLTDADFVRAFAAELGLKDAVVEITHTGATVVRRLVLPVPTDQVPGIFRKFVGDEVDIVDRWQVPPVAEDGTCRAVVTVHAQAGSREAAFEGTALLAPCEDGGTELTVAGDVHVDLPLVGRQAKGLLGQLIVAALKQQTKVVLTRLSTAVDG